LNTIKNQSQYIIIQGRDFLKDVKKIMKGGESSILKDIQRTFDELKQDPYTKRPKVDIKLISSRKDATYRVRLGKYRLIYEIDEATKTIYVTMFFIRGKGY